MITNHSHVDRLVLMVWVTEIPTRLLELRVDHFLAGEFFRNLAGHAPLWVLRVWIRWVKDTGKTVSGQVQIHDGTNRNGLPLNDLRT